MRTGACRRLTAPDSGARFRLREPTGYQHPVVRPTMDLTTATILRWTRRLAIPPLGVRLAGGNVPFAGRRAWTGLRKDGARRGPVRRVFQHEGGGRASHGARRLVVNRHEHRLVVSVERSRRRRGHRPAHRCANAANSSARACDRARQARLARSCRQRSAVLRPVPVRGPEAVSRWLGSSTSTGSCRMRSTGMRPRPRDVESRRTWRPTRSSCSPATRRVRRRARPERKGRRRYEEATACRCSFKDPRGVLPRPRTRASS